MSINVNNGTWGGRLTKDVELRDAGSTKVARGTIAIDRPIKREGQPEADFFDFQIWGKAAEYAANNGKKGMEVVVVGAMEKNRFTAKDGTQRTDVVINANSITLGKKPKDAEAPADESDGIPFA